MMCFGIGGRGGVGAMGEHRLVLGQTQVETPDASY